MPLGAGVFGIGGVEEVDMHPSDGGMVEVEVSADDVVDGGVGDGVKWGAKGAWGGVEVGADRGGDVGGEGWRGSVGDDVGLVADGEIVREAAGTGASDEVEAGGKDGGGEEGGEERGGV